MKRILLCAGLFAGLLSTSAFADEAALFGRWLTKEGKGAVEIGPCAKSTKSTAEAAPKICGRLVWLKKPLDDKGVPKTDHENPDSELRSQPLVGINLLSGFTQSDEGEWDDGQIYDPEDGGSYSSSLLLSSPETLDVEGCILFFCRSQVWRRIIGSLPASE